MKKRHTLEEKKLSLFTANMIVLKILKNWQKLLEPISEFNRVLAYKGNTQKLTVFLYTSRELVYFKI